MQVGFEELKFDSELLKYQQMCYKMEAEQQWMTLLKYQADRALNADFVWFLILGIVFPGLVVGPLALAVWGLKRVKRVIRF